MEESQGPLSNPKGAEVLEQETQGDGPESFSGPYWAENLPKGDLQPPGEWDYIYKEEP